MSNNPQLSRRRFLIGTAGVSIVALGGLGGLAFIPPTITFIEQSYGEAASANGKILVAYASQYGSTGGIADAIGKAFYADNLAVDVRRVDNVTDLSPYRAVVVGAPVISEEWMPAAMSFVERHRASLAQMPTAFFLTCMTLGIGSEPTEVTKIRAVVEKVQATFSEVKSVEFGLFAGALDYNKMSYANRMLYQVFSPDDTDGDYRDFNAVAAWAHDLRPQLVG